MDKYAHTLICEEYQEQYFNTITQIFERYKLPQIHKVDLIYIIGQHLFIYQYLDEKYLDALECKEPLDFIKGYIEQTNFISKTSRSEDALKSKLNARYIELVNPSIKNDTPIKIGNADLAVKAIYQLLRKQHYHSLMQLLEPHEEIPPVEVIDELLKEVNYIINYRSYFVAEIAEDILDYTNTYLEKELSRKQTLFISDLLIVSDIFQLASDKENQLFELTTNFNKENIDNLQKTAYLKRTLKNHRKFIKG
ncbi:MAG: hypothetical protein REI64_11910 [Pedobacter sp.]|uniref:hypothetical protein n=1 Tax=Bacteroidota TaxID=976 RepID=UPI0028070D73|nr:hypothetical protein [Pedobacter sp.]MDQ8005497.1 hypothetical protein [Pedobacter sp.]